MRLPSSPVLALLLTLQAATNDARGESPEEKETILEAPARPAEMPLAPLPDPPPIELPSPRPLAIEAIDRLLDEILAVEPMKRERARRQLLEAKPDWVSGLARRVDQLADRGGRREMAELVSRVRRDSSRDAEDFLIRVQDLAKPGDAHGRSLIQILAINRMLAAIGTTPAVRELTRVYARFGEFIRIDVQNQLDSLGDRALAGLLEAEQHPAESVRRWAKRQLDLRGKAIAHELVRTDSAEALADILVALGRTRNPDAGQILLSYAAVERLQLQLAARQGIALLGDTAAWALRDAYLQTTGKRPPREWTWKRLARELFTEFDRLRLERLYSLYESAKKAAERGELEAMKRDLDEILLENPLFEEREKMAPLYLQFARAFLEKSPEAARSALRRAARIGQGEEQAQAESLVLALEARDLEAKGLYDRSLIDMATALDPKNPVADGLRKDERPEEKLSPIARYGLAAGALLIAALGALVSLGVTWRRKRALEASPQEDGLAPEEEDSSRASSDE